MNIEAQIELKRILKKGLHELTPQDKVFMRARRDYIGRRSREKFKSILMDTPHVQTQKEPKQTQEDIIKTKLQEAAQEPEQAVDIVSESELDLNNPYEVEDDEDEITEA